jgi:vacuolar-type H+-ATPase catalytic subunit A/Vma1
VTLTSQTFVLFIEVHTVGKIILITSSWLKILYIEQHNHNYERCDKFIPVLMQCSMLKTILQINSKKAEYYLT